MTQEKLLDKLAKLKAMADSAKAIGSEAEAQAFAEKLQQMLLDHDLKMTDIEFSDRDRDEPIEERMIDYSKFPDVKVRGARVQWMETLAAVIAKAHFCQIMVLPNSSRLGLIGRASHIAVAEFMIVTLQRAAESIADKEYVRYFYECRDRGDVTQARGFRAAFLMGFITRLKIRYGTTRELAASTGSTALVRLNKEEAALAAHLAARSGRNAKGLARRRVENAEGFRRGTAAADRVGLRSNAIGGATKTAVGQLR